MQDWPICGLYVGTIIQAAAILHVGGLSHRKSLCVLIRFEQIGMLREQAQANFQAVRRDAHGSSMLSELHCLQEDSVDAFVDLLLLAGRALGPIIRRFISLGLNRVWTKAGDTVYRQGEPAESLYILISGRLRLLRADPDGEGPMVVEEEVRSPAMHGMLCMSFKYAQAPEQYELRLPSAVCLSRWRHTGRAAHC